MRRIRGIVALTLGAVLLLGVAAVLVPHDGASSAGALSATTRSSDSASFVSAESGSHISAQPQNLQLAWTNLTPGLPQSPPARQSGGMAYDSTDQEVVLFGGELDTVLPARYYNDTWTFAHGAWTNITGPVAPSPRWGFMMADDPADHSVVLFGGQGPSPGRVTYHDTWEFHAGTWTNVTGAVAPPARYWASMSYDSATGQVLLFGGNQALHPTYSNDTWAFHAGVWTQLSPAHSPSPRDGQNQVDDLADDEVVLFGGLNSSGDLNDTWAYANTTWTDLANATGPDVRTGAGMAYDAAAGVVVMYGGYPANSFFYTTWLFHAGTWVNYSLNPTPPAGTIWGQMAYDAAAQEVLLFEGDGLFDGTWALNISTPPPLTLYATATPHYGPVPLTVAFTAVASGGIAPYSYVWKFGDGNSSSDENPVHQYAHPGNYSANVTVTDKLNASATENWTIDVLIPALNATIAATPSSATVGETVAFTTAPSGGVGPYTFSWTFGDNASSTTQDPTHAYSASGSFRVNLLVEDSQHRSVARNLTVTITSSSSGMTLLGGWTLWVIIAVVLLLILLVVLLLLRRRRSASAAESPPSPQEPPAPPAGEPTGPPPSPPEPPPISP